MALFMVSSIYSDGLDNEKNIKLTETIEKEVAESDRQAIIKDLVWLISFESTAEKLAEKLGINKGGIGSALVVRVAEIAGFGPRHIGDWMATKRED